MSTHICLIMLVVLLSVTSYGYCCHLSNHGELLECEGAPVDAIASDNSYVAPGLFSVLELGGVHACAIRYPSGRVLCWYHTAFYRNNALLLSVNTGPADAPVHITEARALSLGALHSCALWGVLNILTCWGSDIGLYSPVVVSHNVRMVAVGHPLSHHVCFLYVSMMDVSCIGMNDKGQLGLGPDGLAIDKVPAEYIVSYI
jgi:hypothetical protein